MVRGYYWALYAPNRICQIFLLDWFTLYWPISTCINLTNLFKLPFLMQEMLSNKHVKRFNCLLLKFVAPVQLPKARYANVSWNLERIIRWFLQFCYALVHLHAGQFCAIGIDYGFQGKDRVFPVKADSATIRHCSRIYAAVFTIEY